MIKVEDIKRLISKHDNDTLFKCIEEIGGFSKASNYIPKEALSELLYSATLHKNYLAIIWLYEIFGELDLSLDTKNTSSSAPKTLLELAIDNIGLYSKDQQGGYTAIVLAILSPSQSIMVESSFLLKRMNQLHDLFFKTSASITKEFIEALYFESCKGGYIKFLSDLTKYEPQPQVYFDNTKFKKPIPRTEPTLGNNRGTSRFTSGASYNPSHNIQGTSQSLPDEVPRSNRFNPLDNTVGTGGTVSLNDDGSFELSDGQLYGEKKTSSFAELDFQPKKSIFNRDAKVIPRNLKDENGNTGLHLAIKNKADINFVKLLIEQNPMSCYQRNEKNETPFSLAYNLDKSDYKAELTVLLREVLKIHNTCATFFASKNSKELRDEYHHYRYPTESKGDEENLGNFSM